MRGEPSPRPSTGPGGSPLGMGLQLPTRPPHPIEVPSPPPTRDNIHPRRGSSWARSRSVGAPGAWRWLPLPKGPWHQMDAVIHLGGRAGRKAQPTWQRQLLGQAQQCLPTSRSHWRLWLELSMTVRQIVSSQGTAAQWVRAPHVAGAQCLHSRVLEELCDSLSFLVKAIHSTGRHPPSPLWCLALGPRSKPQAQGQTGGTRVGGGAGGVSG